MSGRFDSTLNLPRTDFSMRANLKEKEPRFLSFWKELQLYKKLLERPKDKSFILHDGPPYANGEIHMGHALNKILKDIVVKYKILRGFYAPFVPGWDCHGLPIEHQVVKREGNIEKKELRKKCREFALKYVNIQREQFIRLGVFGDWDNPYLTMAPHYQAKILSVLKELFEAGYLYRGKKPVYWCPNCQTALAEAEVEYKDVSSPSIFVKFLAKDPPFSIDLPVYYIIWTTTPWTLPANLALAFKPDAAYIALKVGEEVHVIMEDLFSFYKADTGIDGEILASVPGKEFEGRKAHHPFYKRESLCVLADFVSSEQGTGIVHIAPGHGQEDYEVGMAYSLDIFSPVDGEGRFTEIVKEWKGLKVFEADPLIIKYLEEKGRLVKKSEILHSYPHCWRCKNPVIFRATDQWFLSLDHKNLRERLLKEIENVNWVPSWGKERIYNMVAGRTDWCLSRQRAWGVPIPALKCSSCGHVWIEKKVFEDVIKRTEKEGVDFWFDDTYNPSQLFSLKCPQCGSADITKMEEILDVWFDSSVSYRAVLEAGKWNLSWPADLYIEGSDQHRGWFQVSLITSVATKQKAPYRTVLTHGFMLDEQGRAMHKSAGNVISPMEIVNKYGADLLRLWVSSEDYRSDVAIGDTILSQIVDSYRKIRNVIRFLLGNLFDFSLRQRLSLHEMFEIDRYMLSLLAGFLEKCEEFYEKYEFYKFYRLLYNYVVVDLSAFYLDLLKDRLYTWRADSQGRRSAQTVLWWNARVLLSVLAPILSFTCEEAWQYFKHMAEEDTPSIFLVSWPELPAEFKNSELEEIWNRIREVKEEVNRALENLRKQNVVGNSLEAKAVIKAPGRLYELLAERIEMLPEVFIVSQVEVVPSESGLRVEVDRAEGMKCERCWRYDKSVKNGLCSRCREVLSWMGKV